MNNSKPLADAPRSVEPVASTSRSSTSVDTSRNAGAFASLDDIAGLARRVAELEARHNTLAEGVDAVARRAIEPLLRVVRPNPSAATPAIGDRLTLKASEVAEYLGISERSLWSITNMNEIPSLRVGRRVLFPVAGVEEWIRNKSKRGSRAWRNRPRESA